eukprot:jgi/Botrbrau1/8904/Bobra.0148s0019.1
MVVSKGSRKGKKAWRRNIDTTQEEDTHAEQSRLERQGLVVGHLTNDQLFFLDKEGGENEAGKPIPVSKRRKEKKPLRSQVILSQPQNTIPVAKPGKRKPKNPVAMNKQKGSSQAGALVVAVPQSLPQKKRRLQDVWEDDNLNFLGKGTFVEEDLKPAKPGPHHRPYHRMKYNPVPAVEIDGPGCSYNPDPDNHQEALAVAVAAEVRKALDREMAGLHRLTASFPGRINYDDLDELELLQVDAEPDEEEGQEDEQADGSNDDAQAKGGKKELRRKLQADRNREERRRAAEQEAAERKALKKQRRDIDHLKQLTAEMAVEDAEKEALLLRKKLNKLERLTQRPPRLGKHIFKPEPIQVLLTEEVEGSLRRLRACTTLAKSRFLALQKRGVIEPRIPIAPKKAKTIEYEPGGRADRARARQDEVDEILRHNRLAAKAAKKAAT